MKHTKSWRISQHQEIKKLISEYKVLAIGNLEGFPASLLQKLKKRLEDVTFRVTSKSVLKKVLNAEGHKDVLEKLPNQAILILTNKNAFELYTAIKKAKPNQKHE